MGELQDQCLREIEANLPIFPSLSAISPMKSTELFALLVRRCRDLHSLIPLVDSQSLYTKYLYLEGQALGDCKRAKRLLDFYLKQGVCTRIAIEIDCHKLLASTVRICRPMYKIAEFEPLKLHFVSVSFRQFVMASVEEWLFKSCSKSVKEIEFVHCDSLELIAACLRRMECLVSVKIVQCIGEDSTKNALLLQSIHHVEKLDVDWQEITVPREACWKQLVVPRATFICVPEGVIFDSIVSVVAMQKHESLFGNSCVFPSITKCHFIGRG